MNENQRCVYMFAQSIAAMAEIEGMKAENARVVVEVNEPPTHNEAAFLAVIDKYGLGHNTLLTELLGR